MELTKKSAPIIPEFFKGVHYNGAVPVFADQLPAPGLVEDAVGFPFLRYRIFCVYELEDQAGALAGSERDREFISRAGGPAAGDSISAGSVFYDFRERRASVSAYESVSVRIKPVNGAVYGENSVHIAALSVLCAVINSGVIEFAVVDVPRGGGLSEAADLPAEVGLYFDFSRRQISLEVFLVVIGIPQAPLYIREDFEILAGGGIIPDVKKHDLAAVAHRNEVQLVYGYAVFA